MTKPFPPLLFALSLVVPLTACDALVDGDHRGTPLATLSGTVRNLRTQPVENAEVSAVWSVYGDGDTIEFETIAVDGGFPAAFTLSLYTPPSPPAPVPRFAVFLASAPGANLREPAPGDLLGADPENILFYVPADVSPGSWASYVLHSTPAAGYHLYRVHVLTAEEREARQACWANLGPDAEELGGLAACGGYPDRDDLVPAPNDLDTPLAISIVDDPQSIVVPTNFWD